MENWQFSRLPFSASNLLLCCCLAIFLVANMPSSASTRPHKPAPKPQALPADYGPALAAANHFLEAWRIADLEIGMSLLSPRVREKTPERDIQKLFANFEGNAYEIARGKPLHPGSYEFPIVLMGPPGKEQASRRTSTLTLVKTGNDWLVDNLP